MNDTARAAETAARASYGRLVAILASRSRDIANAEDALADAFAKALSRWPQDGVPANPDAWLLTVARNTMTDAQRRDARLAPQEDIPDMPQPLIPDFPDERLKLLFVCAHPAIDRSIHTPLMLQTCLGIEAGDIARAFAIAPTAMAQRLVRAKKKIKASGIAFCVPEPEALPLRTTAVLEAIYGAYALDWGSSSDDLTGEALYLATLMAQLMPDDPEPLGLAALIAFGQARRDARIQDGTLVPIHQQDITLWDAELTHHAFDLLRRAKDMNHFGRFQIEAAIQSVHADRRASGQTDWQALAQLNDALHRLYPTLGTAVSHAAAIGQARSAQEGLHLLQSISPAHVQAFQPFHATHAHLLAETGQIEQALTAYDHAINLSTDAPSTRYLQRQRDALRHS